MSFVNVGAYVNGKHPKTKKALREALASDPSSVIFDVTSMFERSVSHTGSDLDPALTLVVTGPDPHRDRRWYA